MTFRFYDVIVIGGELSSLFCGAVLAKRGFRVLLLGHNYFSPTYSVGGIHLPRAPFTFLGSQSPITQRFLSELRLIQHFRRLASPQNPSFQLVLPQHRLNIYRDKTDLEIEIEREFPKVKRSIVDFHRTIQQISWEFDKMLECDLTWPPETFWEKREFARASSHQPFDRAGQGQDLLAEFPEDHPFRIATLNTTCFSSQIDPNQMTTLRLSRLYTNWHNGAMSIEGGLQALHQLLQEKIQSHSGTVLLKERVGSILVQRGKACGVRLDASDEEIGCNFVIAGIRISDLLHLLSERIPFEQLFERIGEPQLRYYRYSINLVVKTEGVPDELKRDVFYLRDKCGLQSVEDLIHIQVNPLDKGQSIITVEILLPRRQIEDMEGHLSNIREQLLEDIRELLPFLDEYLILIDSPHDGRQPELYQGKATLIAEKPWERGPEFMPCVYAYPVTSGLGLCAMPIHTPLKQLLLCNEQVVPGLGIEGLLMAAWSTARIVTRSEPSKERMFRGLWTKVQI